MRYQAGVVDPPAGSSATKLRTSFAKGASARDKAVVRSRETQTDPVRVQLSHRNTSSSSSPHSTRRTNVSSDAPATDSTFPLPVLVLCLTTLCSGLWAGLWKEGRRSEPHFHPLLLFLFLVSRFVHFELAFGSDLPVFVGGCSLVVTILVLRWFTPYSPDD